MRNQPISAQVEYRRGWCWSSCGEVILAPLFSLFRLWHRVLFSIASFLNISIFIRFIYPCIIIWTPHPASRFRKVLFRPIFLSCVNGVHNFKTTLLRHLFLTLLSFWINDLLGGPADAEQFRLVFVSRHLPSPSLSTIYGNYDVSVVTISGTPTIHASYAGFLHDGKKSTVN